MCFCHCLEHLLRTSENIVCDPLFAKASHKEDALAIEVDIIKDEAKREREERDGVIGGNRHAEVDIGCPREGSDAIVGAGDADCSQSDRAIRSHWALRAGSGTTASRETPSRAPRCFGAVAAR